MLYKPKIQILDYKPNLIQISKKRLDKRYEDNFYKLHKAFKLPKKVFNKNKVGVLFLHKLLFKYETLVGVPSKQILNFTKIKTHKLKEKGDYKYIPREKAYI